MKDQTKEFIVNSLFIAVMFTAMFHLLCISDKADKKIIQMKEVSWAK